MYTIDLRLSTQENTTYTYYEDPSPTPNNADQSVDQPSDADEEPAKHLELSAADTTSFVRGIKQMTVLTSRDFFWFQATNILLNISQSPISATSFRSGVNTAT